jgi:hypothetical protein
VPDQDQIVDRSGIGDDQLQFSEPQALQILHIAAQILNSGVRADLMAL